MDSGMGITSLRTSVLFSLVCIMVIIPCDMKRHTHPVPTYFHRLDANGNVIDRSKHVYNQVFSTKFINKISPLDSATADLSVNLSEVGNGEKVKVTWSGIAAPNATDWIGFYCPVNETASKPLDYFHVTEAERGTWHKGKGSKTVTVYNLRMDCEFRYYRKAVGELYTALVVRSNVLKFKGGASAPIHGHIELTGDPTQMRVMWISGTGRPITFLILQLHHSSFRLSRILGSGLRTLGL